MAGLFRVLLGWLLGGFTRLFTMTVNNFLATKIILGTLFLIILPIVVNNILFDFISTILTQVNTYASANSPSSLQTAISFTGLSAYLLRVCGVLDALSVVLSAITIRFALSWIPFVGPK